MLTLADQAASEFAADASQMFASRSDVRTVSKRDMLASVVQIVAWSASDERWCMDDLLDGFRSLIQWLCISVLNPNGFWPCAGQHSIEGVATRADYVTQMKDPCTNACRRHSALFGGIDDHEISLRGPCAEYGRERNESRGCGNCCDLRNQSGRSAHCHRPSSRRWPVAAS